MHPTIYLASASPRRHELLNQIGIEHLVLNVPAAPGEDEPRHAHESPLQYVQRTALEKAIRAQKFLSIKESAAIITADTTVALGDQVLGKPTDALDAVRILRVLSGKTHKVHTCVVLTWSGQQWQALSTSEVTFATINDNDIAAYIQTNEPFGKAGAYGIQGYAAKFISRLEGSYSGVMGLPLYETATLLKHLI